MDSKAFDLAIVDISTPLRQFFRRRVSNSIVADNVRWCSIAVAKQDVRARQRGMSTEVNLDFRGEPPQPKLAPERDDKGGISKIVLRRDGLQDLVREPLR
jgi:hypothetical protein